MYLEVVAVCVAVEAADVGHLIGKSGTQVYTPTAPTPATLVARRRLLLAPLVPPGRAPTEDDDA